ncbi:MAG: TrmB family transcriptional regulator [Candidatus Saccharimonadales bacterium]
MEYLLASAGLSQPQAKIYLYLLENGEAAPASIAKNTNLTRSNAYKVLERLEDLGLVRQTKPKKKVAYEPADPSALASIVAEERNRVIALEQGVAQAMQQLRNQYRKSTGQTSLENKTGTAAMIAAYQNQAETKQSIYFIKSRADIPFLGFETMDAIRKRPAKYKTQRFGICPDAPESPTNPAIDKSANLTRTWLPPDDYTAPVEWTVSGGELLIQIFDGDGSVITINNQQVADSFRQIWHLIDKNIHSNPNYKPTPPHAKRAV